MDADTTARTAAGPTTLWAETALTPAGWAKAVRVEIGADGRIAAVTPDAPADDATRLAVLLPAPMNLHSHAFQRAMAGLTERRGRAPDAAEFDPERDSFWTWRVLMYRFLDQLTPDDVEAVAAQVQLETLEAGFAGIAEFHYLHHAPGGGEYADIAEMAARLAAAAADTGCGFTLLPVLYERAGCDGRPLAGGQLRFGCDRDRFARLFERCRALRAELPNDAGLGVAPHSLRAVSPESLAWAAALEPAGPVHIHAAEQTAEVAEVEAHLGARPIAWLLNAQGLDARWCVIHATHMTPQETAGLAASGAVAGLCPITEANLGDGIFDGVRYAAAGGRFGVGSDSNVRISLTEELRLLEYSQRLRDRGRALLADDDRSVGRFLWDAACAGGAQAAGRAAGALAPGLWADLVALDTGAPALIGRASDALIDSLIFAGRDGLVAELWSAGRHLVRNGRHIARDRIARRYAETIRSLQNRL